MLHDTLSYPHDTLFLTGNDQNNCQVWGDLPAGSSGPPLVTMCVTLYFIASMCMFTSLLFVFNQKHCIFIPLLAGPKLCAILDVICVYCTCPCCLRVYFRWLGCFKCTAGESVPEKGQHCWVKHSICWNPLWWWSLVCSSFALIFLWLVHEMRYEKQAQWARSWEGCMEIFFDHKLSLKDYTTALLMLHEDVQHNINITWRNLFHYSILDVHVFIFILIAN